MTDTKTLIKALRCSGTPYNSRAMKCEDCPYRLLEEVDEKIPVRHDIEIDGKKYWESCDCDRIVMDAAYMLEKLTTGTRGKNE